MSRARLLACVLLVAAAGAGCDNPIGGAASQSTTVPKANGVPSSWIGGDSGYALLVQWTDADGQLTGELTQTNIGTNPAKLVPGQERLTGQISGTSITLAVGGSVNLTGTITSTDLELSVPQTDGTVAVLSLHPGSVNDYDQAVAALGGQAASAQAQQQQAAAASSAAAAQAARVQQVNYDTTAVRGDIAVLANDESRLKDDVARIPNDLKNQAGDLSAVRAAEQTVLAEGPTSDGTSCADAAGIAADAAGIAADAAGVAADGSGIEADLSALRHDVGQLATDFQQLQTDAAGTPEVTGLPTSDEVATPTTAAHQADASAVAATNQDIDKANLAVASAYQYAAEANSAADCGDAAQAPAPEPRIS